MRRYLLQRFALFVPTLLLASIFVFLVMRVLPGDVALVILGTGGGSATEVQLEHLREQLGLRDPLVVQYGKWLWSMVNGTFGGESLLEGRPIRTILAEQLPATLLLTIYSVLIAGVVSIPLGVVAALYQDKWPDYLVRMMTITGIALPSFWVALLVTLGLLLLFRWVPPIIYSYPWENPLEHFQKMIWAALVLAWYLSSYLARMTRSSLLEVLRQDYIRTAYSKGLPQRAVLIGHALRNTLIPVVTLLGMYLGTLVSGTVILEAIFGIPGIGSQVVTAVIFRDYPVTQSLAMVFIFIMLVVNLVVDLTYSFIDPRVKAA